VTSAAGANGDGYGALVAFYTDGKSLGAFSHNGRKGCCGADGVIALGERTIMRVLNTLNAPSIAIISDRPLKTLQERRSIKRLRKVRNSPAFQNLIAGAAEGKCRDENHRNLLTGDHQMFLQGGTAHPWHLHVDNKTSRLIERL
jgi:hypothetical protein